MGTPSLLKALSLGLSMTQLNCAQTLEDTHQAHNWLGNDPPIERIDAYSVESEGFLVAKKTLQPPIWG